MIKEYLAGISTKYKDSMTSEMGYRADFEKLLDFMFPQKDKYHIHHDAKSVGGNKPDFVVLKNHVPVLYIENKDIGVDLDKIEKSNQLERYFGYTNLILTDQLEFRFYRNGERYGAPIKIATYDKTSRSVNVLPENFDLLQKTIVDFCLEYKEPIKRGRHLAQIMGGKAQRIRDNVLEMIVSDTSRYEDLVKMRDVIKTSLVSSLDDESFADMYAQTLVYGLFAARYNDKTPDDFSRAEARELVPKTNPFLRSFFDHIAGNTFPDRLRYIVDELCEVFSHADIHKLLTSFYASEKDTKDPIIHFYEDFLKEYDAKKKMDMGVFYTPRPVVQFIVRAVDNILKNDFGVSKGLSDTSKVKIKRKEIYQAKSSAKSEQVKDGKEIEIEHEYHKVQILDVATGTGTFLNEVIQHIHKGFVGQEGRWDGYVKGDLLPRLHGFELMMASYTIAHLKLGMTLQDFGANDINERLGVYLTNTLEDPVDYKNQNTLFGIMDSIADESKHASRIKAEYPIMCVIGNPPYSGESMNPGYTDNDVYKVEPGGQVKLKERNPKWINDDYVKFIRFAESLIEKNGEGVVGMITAHGYIDNPTFRGMRWHLRKTFDKIYIVDLHGNSNKKETTLDGKKDENVFDIKTGVSIIFGVKNKSRTGELGDVYKTDLYGLREDKFSTLDSQNIESINWTKLPEDTELWVLEGQGKSEYLKGFSVAEVFPVNSVGVVTAKDKILINENKNELLNVVREFYSIEPDDTLVQRISYRPFDNRYVYFDTKLVERSREKVMQHFVNKENIGLVSQRGSGCDGDKNTPQLTRGVIDQGYSYPATTALSYAYPLYLYTPQGEKIPNINKEIWNKINEVVGGTTPENILDYIYAVLHSPSYREKYKEFLKIDFPRVPYPENKSDFQRFVGLGEKLRGLHLMNDPVVNKLDTTFPESGNDEVEKIAYKDGKVFINEKQYFGNVPEVAWNFYIGGYQPAQKWLKDRKDRKLTNDDIEHYQKIVKVLVETEGVMREVDVAGF
jgi:predicted helicase